MVTLNSAEEALKTLYLGVVSEQLNTSTNPLYNAIEKTSSDVWGKEIVKLVPFGLNGGISAGDEDGDLPNAAGNNYERFTLELKNLFGKISISDKAIRASETSAGAFVNLLNAEMEGLLRASKFNFGRMLYGDGTGKLGTVVAWSENTNPNKFKLDSVRNLMEGMVIDIYPAGGAKVHGRRITHIDRENAIVTVDGGAGVNTLLSAGDYITVQNSYGKELTGLGAIFAKTGKLYGLNKEDYSWLVPYTKSLSTGFAVTDMQEAIDKVEERAGSAINFIVASADARRVYLNELMTERVNIDYMNLDGGFKAVSYNGIPVVADRFVPEGTMYLLDTNDFKLHQLCDWKWLESGEGRILHQDVNKATYTATLVKYADLICDRPFGQACITGIA